MLAQMDMGMRAGMEQGLRQSLHGGTPTSGQKAKMDEFQTKFTAILKDELSYAKMRDIYLQTYRETFTQDEVNSIITFYSAPAGKAMVEKVPIAMQKEATLTQARLGPFIQKLQTMAEQFGKDLETKK